MAKFHSPLLGYNNNVRHRGRVFHIQTEDSGVNHPHVITHLFMDGGRILKSVKRSYAEHVGSEKMAETVRLLMKEQHKAMFIALRDGQFDELVEGAHRPPSPAVTPTAKAAVAAAPTAERPPLPVTSTPSSPDVLASQPSLPQIEAPLRVEAPLRDDPPPPGSASAAAEPEKARRPSASELTLDFDALERAADDDGAAAIYAHSDLPPPPKNLFSKEPHMGVYGAAAPREQQGDANEHASTPQSDAGGQTTTRRRPSSRPLARPALPAREGRYAPSRPATIFGAAASAQAAPSIFSDELVTDKSLDEVILSYLTEDLDSKRRP